MQSIEFVLGMILALISTFFGGGLLIQYVIRKLETKEREKEGDIAALIFLREAAAHVALVEEHGIAVISGEKWRYRQERVVNGLIHSTARCQEKHREELYNTAKKISDISIRNFSFPPFSPDILILIEKIEESYFSN